MLMMLKSIAFIVIICLAFGQEVPECQQRIYCVRHRYITDQIYQQNHPQLTFQVQDFQHRFSNNVTFKLNSRQTSLLLATDLNVTLEFYQEGQIMKVTIDENNMPNDHRRFRYESDVNDSQLEHANIQKIQTEKLSIIIILNQAKYIISQESFKIEQYLLSDKNQYIRGLVVNPIGTLQIENSNTFYSAQMSNAALRAQSFVSLYSILPILEYFKFVIDGYLDTLIVKANQIWAQRYILGQSTWPHSKLLFNYWVPKHVQEFNDPKRKISYYPDLHQYVSIGFWFQTTNLYGLPQRADTHYLKETRDSDPYSLLNKDRFPHQGSNSKTGLYASIPFIMSDQSQGLLWQNAAETWVDVWPLSINETKGEFVQFMSKSGQLCFYVMQSNSAFGVSKLFNSITGRAPIPNILSLGFHYSTWENITSEKIMRRDNDFTKYGFPVDYFWLDLLYTDFGNYFDFNPVTFASKGRMDKQIEQSGRRLVIIADPHFKVAKNVDYQSQLYIKGMQLQTKNIKQIFVKDERGFDFLAQSWPGLSVWVDFFSPDASLLWQEQIEQKLGDIYDLWIDMNEPSVFNILGLAMPDTNSHYGGVKHHEVRNAYGVQMQKATYEALLQRSTRPFLLSRSTFTGGHQYGALWTGDNMSTYEELKGCISTILQLSIAGFSFVGADIPGFYGDPDDDLTIAFYQLSVWLPFMRAHGHFESQPRDPWLRNHTVQQAIRDSIWLRYSLIHYLMTCFYLHNQYGEPILRPMWYQFQNESYYEKTESLFMFGPNLLIIPQLNQFETLTQIKLPSQHRWFDFSTKQAVDRNKLQRQQFQQLVFVTSGSIVPILKHQQELALSLALNNPISLHIYGNPAQGILYMDSNKNDKQAVLIQFTYFNNTLQAKTTAVFGEYFDISNQVIDEIVFSGYEGHQPDVFTAEQLYSDQIEWNQDQKVLRLINLGIRLSNFDIQTLVSLKF